MPIVKLKKHSHPYVIIDKRALHDPRLSWKAKGLMAYLLCKPDDWQVVLADLVNRSRDGERSVRGGLNELRNFRYAKFAATRDGHGHLTGTAWTIYEEPCAFTETAVLATSAESDARQSPTSTKLRPTNNDYTLKDVLRTSNLGKTNRARAAKIEEEKLLVQLKQICGPAEMKKNGGCWRLRARNHARTLRNAIEDWYLRKDNYRRPIRNSAAWLNKKFKINETSIRRHLQTSQQVPSDQKKLSELVTKSLAEADSTHFNG
jgi:hypothetical protein